jgi:Helix-turn-helix domain
MPGETPSLRLVPDGPNPFAIMERCMASWVDERLRTVLDEKLREWVSKSPSPTNGPSGERPEYLSRDGAAQLTGYSAKTIMRWIRAGKLRPYGLRGERVKRVELERLMADLPSSEAAAGETETEIARRILDGDRPEDDR